MVAFTDDKWSSLVISIFIMLTLMDDTDFWVCIIAAKCKHGPVYSKGSDISRYCQRLH